MEKIKEANKQNHFCGIKKWTEPINHIIKAENNYFELFLHSIYISKIKEMHMMQVQACLINLFSKYRHAYVFADFV